MQDMMRVDPGDRRNVGLRAGADGDIVLVMVDETSARNKPNFA